jgi:DNA-binding Lrp family transcriptional regulator
VLTRADRALLDELQYRFPLAARPYRIVARRLGMTEQEVLARLAALQDRGIVRYTGVTFDLRRLGLHSTLAALAVPRARAAQAARIVNRCPQVSHNYARTGKYPLWFTVSARSKKELDKILEGIRRATGAAALLDLRTTRVFKARALFRMGG